MRTQFLFSLAAVAATASAQSSSAVANAPVVTGNPVGATYLATLPDKKGSTVRGSVSANSSPDGKGVVFKVAISGLPAEGGPFMYHIHEKPVPADGNCTGTGAHLDPYKRGEVPACDASKPETCQTGDLSGKHGNATTQSFAAEYIDLYTATNPSDLSYFGNLAVVVHLSNKTRISCANFSMVAPGASSLPVTVPSSGYAAPTGTAGFNHTLTMSHTLTGTGGPTAGEPTTGSPIAPTAPAQTTNAAHKIVGGAGALMAAAAALML